jgi:hypothetical protein
MVLAIAPFSVNSNSRPAQKRKAAFIERMRGEAARRFQGEPMFEGHLYARITWLHDNQQGDLDNIIKAILDALQSVVYASDRLLVKCLAEKIDLSQENVDLEGDDQTARDEVSPIRDEVLALIEERHPHILYVEIGEVGSQRLIFGPVEQQGDRI